MVLVEQHYKDVRRKLDDMGFYQPCSIESILLVDKLLNELICTRDELTLNKDLAHNTHKKCKKMENSLEIFKQEKQRLLKENNKMHSDAIHLKEEMDKSIKQLKMRISDLENMYSDLEFNYMEQTTNMETVRQKLLHRTNKLQELGINIKDDDEPVKSNLSQKYNCTDKINTNSPENVEIKMENYKKKHHQLLDEIEIIKRQLETRDIEIARLRHQQETHFAVTEDEEKCSCHLTNSRLTSDAMASADMFEKLKAAQHKQHEAMQKAIKLADHIRKLETELNRLKGNNDENNLCKCGSNIAFLQKHHIDTTNKIKDMEIRITSLHSVINNLTGEKEEAKKKIHDLEKEKNSLIDRIQDCKRIENDLISEIDRLKEGNANMKDEIAQLIDKNSDLQTVMPIKTGKNTQNKSKTESNDIAENVNDSLLQKIKAERNYYCNELHRIQEKMLSVERLHEIQCSNRLEKELDISRITKLQNDIYFAEEENKCLHKEVINLKKQIKDLSNRKYDANKLQIENEITQCDKNTLALCNSHLQTKLKNMDEKYKQLDKKIILLTEEIEDYKIKYCHSKKLNVQLELSLKNSEGKLKQVNADLLQSITKIKDLEKDLHTARKEIISIKKEKQEIKENLLKCDSEKDELLLKIDEKTIFLAKLNKDLHCKNSEAIQMENKICELKVQIQTLERVVQASEVNCRLYVQDTRKIEQEMNALQTCKDNLFLENQTLKKELEALSHDIIISNQAFEKCRNQSEELKRELQTYVDEIRRVEKILLEKEREREALLEQFNVLSAEASHLEGTQHSLELEANISRDNLRDAQEKLYTLEKQTNDKDSLLSNMKSEIRQLSDQVVQLQKKIAEMSEHELLVTSDLDAARNLCSTLEDQKQRYCKRLGQIESNEKDLYDRLNEMKCENETLHNQLSHEQNNSLAMGKMFASSRYFTMEKCLDNEDLTKEVEKMKETIVALETKLNSMTSALSDCQSTCAEYSMQNVQLRREITNERFEKAKHTDSNSTSL